MHTCNTALPEFLNPVPSTTEHDDALTESQYTATWRHFECFARMLVRAEIGRTSLHAAEARAGHQVETRSLLARHGAVRAALRRDTTLVDDIAQDVALLLLLHVRARRIRRAAPFVREWLRNAVRWLVRGGVREQATLYFGSGSASTVDEDVPCLAEASTRPRDAFDPEFAVEVSETLQRVRSLGGPRSLVLEARLRGYENDDIAHATGMNGNTVRVHVHRGTLELANESREAK